MTTTLQQQRNQLRALAHAQGSFFTKLKKWDEKSEKLLETPVKKPSSLVLGNTTVLRKHDVPLGGSRHWCYNGRARNLTGYFGVEYIFISAFSCHAIERHFWKHFQHGPENLAHEMPLDRIQA